MTRTDDVGAFRLKRIAAVCICVTLLLSGLLGVIAMSSKASALTIDARGTRAAPQKNSTDETGAYTLSLPIINPDLVPSVLVVQDNAPWGFNAITDVLTTMGIPYNQINSAAFAAWDLTGVTHIILPSVQTNTYYANMAAQMPKLSAWVSAGGYLQAHGCDQSSTHQNNHVPGGLTQFHSFSQQNIIIDPGHPYVAGLTNADFLNWNWVNHDVFTTASLPTGTKIIMQDNLGNPTVVEYPFGSGKILATGQTIEYAYGNGYNIETLPNMNLYVDLGGLNVYTPLGWLNNAWKQRLIVNITNPNPIILFDYQVKATIFWQPGMRFDYADLRFTYYDGLTLIPYWFEKGTGTSADFWLKIDWLPANYAKSIYVYYDNPTATSIMNGDAVFEFFDDFFGTAVDTSKWTGDTAQFTVGYGYLQGGNTNYMIQSTSTFSNPIVIETRTKGNTLAPNGQSTLGFYVNAGNSIGLLEHDPVRYWYRNDGNWWGPWNYNFMVWHNAKISINAAGNGQLYVINDLGATTAQTFTNTVSSERISLGMRYDAWMSGQGYNQQWEWIFARKYAATEPTAAIVGHESLPSTIAGPGGVEEKNITVEPARYQEPVVEQSETFDMIVMITVLGAVAFIFLVAVVRRSRRKEGSP